MLRTAAVVLGLGVVVGGMVCGWLYVEAGQTVDALLARPIWTESGRIGSAPVEIGSGVAVAAEEVAQVLQGSGYSRVEQVAAPGDFQVSDDAILLRHEDEEILLTFSGGRITTVSPSDPVIVNSMELAGIRGPEGEARRPVTRDAVPQHLVEAVLAMEDARFYEHEGIDPWGIVRALVVNLVDRERSQGGSTLTQQLAKNLFLTQEKTYERKVRELALAVALERRLTKDQILELYLNQIYLGQSGGVAICGVDQAARVYFGTAVDRLDLGQAATLAGIISAPNRYSPLRHPDRARERRALALQRMTDIGWIEERVASAAADRSLGVVRAVANRQAPWALDAAISQVETRLGEGAVAGQSISIQTTIQPLMQRVAERVVGEELEALETRHEGARGAEVALVAVDVQTGDIVALVGGRDYRTSGFNRVMNGRRQIGSTIKPLTWLFAFERDPTLAPSTPVPDEPIERKVGDEVWAPTNYDGVFEGEVTMADALARSRNVPAVMVAEEVGLPYLAQAWRSLGLSGATGYPSAALGAFEATPVEVAGAFTVFPGQGVAVRPRLVRSVRLPSGKEGWSDTRQRQRQTSERAAFLALQTLRGVMEHGTGRGARAYGVDGFVGGKTGTTDGGRDAWFVGFTERLSVAVWVGFDKGRDLGLTGAQAALPIWARFMAETGTVKEESPPAPDEVAGAMVCVESGALATEACEVTAEEWFSSEHAPDSMCVLHGDGARPFEATRRVLESLGDRFRGQPPSEKKKGRGWFRRRKAGGKTD